MCYDEKFFELFYLILYIYIVVFFVLKSIMKIVKAFCLVLYYVYIVFFSYGVFLSFFLYSLYNIIHTQAFLLFLLLPDFEWYNGSISFLLPKHNQFFYSGIKIKGILIKYTPILLCLFIIFSYKIFWLIFICKVYIYSN